jgi:sigma-B regulation protein RsbU (phosphoserine phosphatase)
LTTIHEYLANKIPEFELEHRLGHKDGAYRWILARGAVVRDEQGRPYRMVGSHLDITDRKRSEKTFREREAQLIAAQTIQEHILPRGTPVVPGFDLAGGLTAAEFAAGDFFDYLRMPDGALGVVVGDVSGHGVGAALLMASAAAHLRSFAEEHCDLRQILTHANALLCREVEYGRFVTLFFVQLDTASKTVRYVNAGHPPGYVLGRSGEVKAVLEHHTVPLGILPDANFPVSGPIQLDPDDVLILVTDGLLEAHSPERIQFGMDRVLDVVRANLDRKAEGIIEALQDALLEFTGSEQFKDDVTIVVMKVEEAAASEGA